MSPPSVTVREHDPAVLKKMVIPESNEQTPGVEEVTEKFVSPEEAEAVTV